MWQSLCHQSFFVNNINPVLHSPFAILQFALSSFSIPQASFNCINRINLKRQWHGFYVTNINHIIWSICNHSSWYAFSCEFNSSSKYISRFSRTWFFFWIDSLFESVLLCLILSCSNWTFLQDAFWDIHLFNSGVHARIRFTQNHIDNLRVCWAQPSKAVLRFSKTCSFTFKISSLCATWSSRFSSSSFWSSNSA